MTLTQIMRYLENRDASSITHKFFNQFEQDKYPTYSICVTGNELYLSHEELLFNALGVNSEQYIDILKGYGWRYKFDTSQLLYTKETLKFENISDYKFASEDLKEDLIPLHPGDIITWAHFGAEAINDTVVYRSSKEDTMTLGIPFFTSYRTPDEICFTRKSKDRLGAIRSHDLLAMNPFLLTPGKHLFAELRIIFHYPGQLIRNYGNPSYRSTFASMRRNTVLQLTVSHVTKLINRPDSNIRCYNGIESDDTILRESLIKRIECIPVYWNSILKDIRNKKLCESAEQLRDVYSEFRKYKEYFSTYDRPCVDMTTLVTDSRGLPQRKNQFFIDIVYKDKAFQEIRNVREFTFESFFSSMGGFVGIFLGYSILHIPDLIKNGLAFLKRSRHSQLIGKCLLNSIKM